MSSRHGLCSRTDALSYGLETDDGNKVGVTSTELPSTDLSLMAALTVGGGEM